MCRADMSVSVEELGSLLGHEGKIGEAERNAAKTFGADETYFVLGGTSAANQMIIEACAAENDVAAIDRNCHKSVYHALISTGAEPAYIRPVRNKMGMSGPIPWRATSEENMRGLLAETPGTKGRTPKILTLTNSNYDGVCAEISHFLKNPPGAQPALRRGVVCAREVLADIRGVLRARRGQGGLPRCSRRSRRTKCSRRFRRAPCCTCAAEACLPRRGRARRNLRHAHFDLAAIQHNRVPRRRRLNNGRGRREAYGRNAASGRGAKARNSPEKIAGASARRMVFRRLAARFCRDSRRRAKFPLRRPTRLSSPKAGRRG